ncbi:DUF1176 domain-containing protein [Bosea sp. NPDC055594]
MGTLWFRTRLVPLCGAMLLAAMVPASAQGQSKTFRDWTAGCDNLRSCTALSLPDETAQTVGYLRLERPAGPGGAVSLSLKLTGEKLKAPLTIGLKLDDAPFPAGGKTLAASVEDGETARIVFSEVDTAALIAAARKATRLSATLAGKTYAISLAGSVAAMLWIDEQQGRLNTMTALVRKGPAAASTVPSPPALPVIAARATGPALADGTAKALGAALRKHLKASDPDACEDDDRGARYNPDRAWPLDGRRKLIGLYCGAGAYNILTGYWLVTGDAMAGARKVAFAGNDDNVLINSDYTPENGQLGYFAKVRGIGDCGGSGNYAWTGSDFALTTLSAMGECRQLPSDDWPVLFRSEVKVTK